MKNWSKASDNDGKKEKKKRNRFGGKGDSTGTPKDEQWGRGNRGDGFFKEERRDLFQGM